MLAAEIKIIGLAPIDWMIREKFRTADNKSKRIFSAFACLNESRLVLQRIPSMKMQG